MLLFVSALIDWSIQFIVDQSSAGAWFFTCSQKGGMGKADFKE